jgi:hypothetical protein
MKLLKLSSHKYRLRLFNDKIGTSLVKIAYTDLNETTKTVNFKILFQLSKKIEKMRAERLSKEMKEDKFSSDDLREDEKIINTINTIPAPLIQDENAQNPWDMNTFK